MSKVNSLLVTLFLMLFYIGCKQQNIDPESNDLINIFISENYLSESEYGAVYLTNEEGKIISESHEFVNGTSIILQKPEGVAEEAIRVVIFKYVDNNGIPSLSSTYNFYSYANFPFGDVYFSSPARVQDRFNIELEIENPNEDVINIYDRAALFNGVGGRCYAKEQTKEFYKVTTLCNPFFVKVNWNDDYSQPDYSFIYLDEIEENGVYQLNTDTLPRSNEATESLLGFPQNMTYLRKDLYGVFSNDYRLSRLNRNEFSFGSTLNESVTLAYPDFKADYYKEYIYSTPKGFGMHSEVSNSPFLSVNPIYILATSEELLSDGTVQVIYDQQPKFAVMYWSFAEDESFVPENVMNVYVVSGEGKQFMSFKTPEIPLSLKDNYAFLNNDVQMKEPKSLRSYHFTSELVNNRKELLSEVYQSPEAEFYEKLFISYDYFQKDLTFSSGTQRKTAYEDNQHYPFLLEESIR